MAMIAQSVLARRDDILRIAAHHRAHNVRVFGSVARGDAGPESDLNLLVEAGSESTQRISDERKAQHTEIDWRAIALTATAPAPRSARRRGGLLV